MVVLDANALVSSRLDYCNSLFRGLSCLSQHKLQSIQNTLAFIVTNHRKYTHVTPNNSTGCLLSTVVCPSYFELFLSLSSCSYSTRRSYPDCQCLIGPPFHSSVFKSVKHFGHSLPLMFLRSGMNSLTMCAVENQLAPLGKSSKLICLQKAIHHSFPCQPSVSLIGPDYVIGLTLIDGDKVL